MKSWLSIIAAATACTAPLAAVAAVDVSFALAQPGNAARDLTGMPDLAQHERELRELVQSGAAARLAPGASLQVTFRRVTVAGSYEAWRVPEANRIRFVLPAYPPRVELAFTLTGADGRVVRSGERALTDVDFQRNPAAVMSRDPLRYEKPLIERWLADELAVPY